jgi:hypothetical protein
MSAPQASVADYAAADGDVLALTLAVAILSAFLPAVALSLALALGSVCGRIGRIGRRLKRR